MRISHSPIARRCTLAAALMASLSVLGCGGGKDNPTLFTVSGNVAFNGKPVLAGFVSFEPNAAKGNSGPGCRAPIKNGYYETPKNRGVTGGAYLITVGGTDGVPTIIEGEEAPYGTSIFPPYKTQFDFPKEDTTWNIEVPVASPANSN
jgi:hypothetical protein